MVLWMLLKEQSKMMIYYYVLINKLNRHPTKFILCVNLCPCIEMVSSEKLIIKEFNSCLDRVQLSSKTCSEVIRRINKQKNKFCNEEMLIKILI